MAKIYNLEDGIKETERALCDIFTTGGHVFAAVYGNTESGAVSFVKRVQKFLTPSPQEARYGYRRNEPRALTIWQPFQQKFFDNFINYRQNFWNVAIILHCPWERELNNQCRDPDYLMRDYAHTTIDLRIGIYNPHFSSGIRGEYDLIIANQHLPDDNKVPLELPHLSKTL